MAILKIARMGHPVLRARALKIEDPTAPEVAQLVEDMLETMTDAEGLGLAAPQVHVSRRLVLFRVPPGGDVEDERVGRDGFPLLALVNPVVEALTDEMYWAWEGCLSVPGLRGDVPRYTKIRYTGFTPDGREIDVEAEGLHARVVQHECDHLDGILYPARMDDLSNLIFESEWKYHRRADDAKSDDAESEDAESDGQDIDPDDETDEEKALERAS
jgi:peptide deformylase